jgi:uracil-DNA glycosylase
VHVSRDGLGEWQTLPFFSDTLPAIEAELANDTRAIFPPAEQVFAALRRTQPDAVKVVILGQDPYPTRGHGNGLAFSVAPDVAPLPRSLKNIYRELTDDIGGAPATGDLGGWADQGVLLLNTALTVPEGTAGGHARLGWDALAREVLQRVGVAPRAFLLWGRHAQRFRPYIAGANHLIIETVHPSPLSAAKGFYGSRPFSRVNEWLAQTGAQPINWTAT